jgi:GAF domain-containing protein
MFDQMGIQPLNQDALIDGLFATIPVKVLGGEVVGNLEVSNDPKRPMTPEDIAFLQQVSEQVALALEGARLTAQTQSALAQTEKLYEASRAITATHDEIETVTELVKRIDHTSLDRVVAAMKISDDPVTAHVVAVWDRNGMEDRFIGNRFTDGQIPLISKMHWDEATLINDFDDASNVDPVTQKTFQALGVKSAAIVPISSSGNLIGWILLETTRAPRQFGAEVQSILALAGQSATVIQGQRLLVQSQRQADRESALNTISQKIQSATTVEAVLQIAARELGHALGAPMTIAQLSMKDKR